MQTPTGGSTQTPAEQLRDTLFFDYSFKTVSDHGDNGEPWDSYRAARKSWESGGNEAALQTLNEVAGRSGLESRHYVQCWALLRELGQKAPAEIAKTLYGVVVEVGLRGGTDFVAAYSDLKARYYNFSGAGVVWNHPDESLNVTIQRLLSAAQKIVSRIGPCLEARPPVPAEGQIRINMLTPSGVHFGQGPIQVLQADALGGPVVNETIKLMQQLIAKTKK
jgi:hypothetical protein